MNSYDINLEKVPTHIAIIMDGNGRWAKSRFLPRTAGHKAGVEAIREVIKESQRLGVKHLTLYAFSTDISLLQNKSINPSRSSIYLS